MTHSVEGNDQEPGPGKLELEGSFRLSSQGLSSSKSFSGLRNVMEDNMDEETATGWVAIDRLPPEKRVRSSLFDEVDVNEANGKNKQVVDVAKLRALEKHMFIEKLIQHIEVDNRQLLQKIRKRIDKVGIELPSIECLIYGSKIDKDLTRLTGFTSRASRISIIDDVSGIIKPGRMTLLLGPPGCGKTTLLKALSGNLNKSAVVSGDITYNGYKLTEFVPQKTSAYISQSDVDTFMKASSIEGQKTSLQTDYILRILGLDTCADTLVGDAMRRGISGGEKKRLTTGEMIVGPTRALFMDEISNGLDSSTTYQIVTFLQQLAHLTDATILVSLLQPAPETFDLFDDIILMGDGKIVYHGPRTLVLEFFENCGFRCPERKGVADFLQEVMSRKDQAQYWHGILRLEASMPNWLKWVFWTCPYTYGEIAITINEFLAPRWKIKVPASNTNIGHETLHSRGLDFHENLFWIALAALLGFTLLFYTGFTLALTFLHPVRDRAIISREKFSELRKGVELDKVEQADTKSRSSSTSIVARSQKGNMILPFEPLTVVFEDLQYYVDTPVLLLLKPGGRMIYFGPLGQHSSEVIKYFEGISGVPKIRDNHNPATWMLEITSISSESDLGVDFADIYKNSSLYELSSPPVGAKPLEFPTEFPKDGWGQFKACLWKQHLSYWRSPSYNLMRLAFLTITSLVIGLLFWNQGQKMKYPNGGYGYII
ncbi:OLC1v1038674C1 [Oldenlandia corymbosa var. corymbosa]|uniref:OLC1v1038674C1 n=1 Tax=Oldenlandia corymbosa var. corymbosa TaxID=529605 RepID=A0AAV1D3H5_OLDCO|nr:OLC1v1038674C1 [Oldenlandia corymbosa var. corymbosa]